MTVNRILFSHAEVAENVVEDFCGYDAGLAGDLGEIVEDKA